MATEVQSGDLNGGNASRLEVSIDGLTLSPDSEGEADHTDAVGPHTDTHSDPEPSPDAPGDGEQNTESSVEMIWGFPLMELYGLALKFFKGTHVSFTLSYLRPVLFPNCKSLTFKAIYIAESVSMLAN